MFSDLSGVIHGIGGDSAEYGQPQIKAVLGSVERLGEGQERVDDASTPLKHRI